MKWMFYPYLVNRIRPNLYNFIERNEPLFDYWGRTFYCNSFQLIIGEEKAALIDTGYAYGDLIALVKQYTDLDADLLITHSDLDHRRGAPQFAAAGRRIYMSDLETIPTAPNEKFDFTNISDGDRFDLGGTVLEAILTPGHTKGSVCFYDRANRMLFTGDAVNKLPWLFSGKETIESYLGSLRRLRDLTPEKPDIYCGHAWEYYPYAVLTDSITACEEVLAGNISGDRPYAFPFSEGESPIPDVFEHQVNDVRLCYSTRYIR